MYSSEIAPEAPVAEAAPTPAPASVPVPFKPAAIATRAELSKAYPKIQSDFKKFEVSALSSSVELLPS